MTEIGKYIYGVINSNSNLRLFVPKDLVQGENSTINGVYAIPYQDISAIVCDSEIDDCTHMRKDILAKLLVKHQMVIEKIIGLGYTIIPARLGTFAVDEIEVETILGRGYSLIKDILEKISDKIEIDVASTWSDFPSVLKEVGEEKEIKEFKERILNNFKGITVDDQMKIGFMVKKALDKKREKHAKEIQDTLKIISQDSKVHELMDDKMVANCAFLINKADRKDFDEKIKNLNTQFGEKLNFRCVGPLPPYSFYTLEIKKMQFEEIDWAKRKLGLRDFISKDEIKKTYKAKTFSLHPDKNPNTPGIEKDFDDVIKAYKILTDYCLATEQAGQTDQYSFKEEELKKNAILVKVRE